MMDRLTSIDELAKLIPDVIETEQSHVGLLWGERQKIAEAILDRCVVIVKNEQFMPRPITRENSSIRKCCPEYHTKIQFTTNEKGIGKLND